MCNNYCMFDIFSKKRRVIDIFVILLITVVAALLTEAFHTKALTSMLMFFIAPSVYLLLRRRNLNIFKYIVTAFTMGITVGALDAAITANMGWWIPVGRLVFPVRFWGIWNIDNTLWYMGLIFYIVIFYEYFLDTEKDRKLSSKFCYFVWFPIITSLILISFIVFFPNVLSHVRYAYLTLSIPFVIVPITLLFIYGRKNILELLKKFSIASAFFFVVNLTHEVVALRQNQCIFPGEYIGTIHFAGVIIPIEEFMMYIIIFAFVILTHYEIFVDDLS